MATLVILNLKEIICLAGAVNYRGQGYGRGNNRGPCRGVRNKLDNATGAGYQFNFCKVKEQKGSSDGVESISQGKVDDSLDGWMDILFIDAQP